MAFVAKMSSDWTSGRAEETSGPDGHRSLDLSNITWWLLCRELWPGRRWNSDASE